MTTPASWPEFERPPAVAFVDVDGTLLAQTTTFLFARILYRRGWIRRSFFLRGLYHGLQHRFGRLDYGRLIAIGLKYISRIPLVELERVAYENFAEYVRPRLFEGVVDHLTSLRRSGTPIVLVTSSRCFMNEAGWSAWGRARLAMATASVTGRKNGPPATESICKMPLPTRTTGAIAACWNEWEERSLCTRADGSCGWRERADGTSFDRADLPGRGCSQLDPSVGAGAS
jgi:hypothetical protein